MSDITLPHPTFTDGNVLTADDVWENLYTTEAAPNSYEVINGSLELANVVAPTANSIITQMIQKGSMSGGKGVGATANVDYFPEPFSDWVDNASPSVDLDPYYQAIPGASIEFYLPYAPSVLLLTWQITTRVEATTQDGALANGRIRLFLDGARVSDNVYLDILPAISGLIGGRGGRPWDAHFMKIGGLTKGWHSVSLRIVADKQSGNQVRVLTRNMNYVYFQ